MSKADFYNQMNAKPKYKKVCNVFFWIGALIFAFGMFALAKWWGYLPLCCIFAGSAVSIVSFVVEKHLEKKAKQK